MARGRATSIHHRRRNYPFLERRVSRRVRRPRKAPFRFPAARGTKSHERGTTGNKQASQLPNLGPRQDRERQSTPRLRR